jgi:hypothetical protein
MDDRNPIRMVRNETFRAKGLGCVLTPVVILIGIVGWILWKWYALPIAFGVFFILGSVYSVCVSRKIKRHTGLDGHAQDYCEKLGREIDDETIVHKLEQGTYGKGQEPPK